MSITNQNITKAIIRSQHCQRNWDLSKKIPEEDFEVIRTAITQCPSKQNIAFYNTYFVTNRDVIEKIHAATMGFILDPETKTSTTNTQTLANLVVVFTKRDFSNQFSTTDPHRNAQIDEIIQGAKEGSASWKTLERDRQLAVGIAAGYCNITASLMGYSTGCCLCFDNEKVKEALDTQEDILLIMGVGYSQQGINRRVHHTNHNIVFPTKSKIEIKQTVIN